VHAVMEGFADRRGARRWAALAFCAATALGATTAAAQGGTTTGAIRGQTLTAAGAPVGSVQVTAQDVNTGLERSVRSDSSGRFALLLLPPGVFTVRARLVGYRPDSVVNVDVTIGETQNAILTMSQSAVQLEAVNVGAGRLTLDATDATLSQTVSRQEIENLPAAGRDFTDFINLSGLVDPNPERTTGGQFSIAGGRPSQTSIQIDGVDANNSFFGENRGGSRIPFEFSLESIREFQIITNGYDVEYGNYTGGIVNVVTRGGTNTREGSLYANYSGNQLASKDFAGNPPAAFNVEQYAARLSGPIVRDKAFYLFSIDGQRERQPQVPLTAAYFLNKLDASGKPAPDSAGAADLASFENILSTKYGITNAANDYQNFQTTDDVVTLFGRLDFNLNDTHHLSVRENFADHHNDNLFDPGFDFRYGSDKAEDLGDLSSSLVSELQSITSPTSFNVVRFQLSYEGRPREGNDLRPTLTVTDIGDGQSASYGGTFVSLDNNLIERKAQLVDNFTSQHGNQTFKFGANGIFSHLYNSFVGPTGSVDNTAGYYTFSSLAALSAMTPTSYTRSETVGGTVPTSVFNVGEYAVYGQDEWRPTPRLTTTFGLRYDIESFLDHPARVIPVEQAFGVTTGNAPTDNNNVSPRLSLAYDVHGNGSAVARAGVGYFYGRLPYVTGGNVSGSVNPVLALTCAGSASSGAPDAPPAVTGYSTWSTTGVNDPVTCAGGATGTGVPTYTLWKDHFQFPESFKANLGYDQIIWRDTKLSLNLIGSRSFHLYTVRDINLRPVQFTLSDEGGREVFVPAASFNPSSATSTMPASRLNANFAQVYVNYDDGQAESMAGTVELVHNLSVRTQVRASYTYTTAYDNSSYTCCTASDGFDNPTVGAYGPNDIGPVGATDKSWGPSSFVRNHVIVLSGNTSLPWGFRVSGIWRFQSGDRWGPEQGGDLNGDGVNYNDRPFIFAPADLPLSTTDSATAASTRARYATYLSQYPCIGKYVGQIIPRNSCTLPWFNKIDMQFAKSITAGSGHRAELQVDLYNVLNGINHNWGRYMGVFGAATDLLTPNSYDPVTNRILYSVPSTFGSLGVEGTNLLLQFQAKVGLKISF